MPRSRHITVLETAQELRRIETSLQKDDERKRIALLRLLKRNPALTLKEAAEKLGVTHHATKRWWRWYIHGGIARLQKGVTGKPVVSDDRALHALRENIASGTFRSIEQVVEWLGAGHSRSEPQRESGALTIPPFTRQGIDFLNAIEGLKTIPSTGDWKTWTDLFRTVLTQAFQDIDRVSVIINIKCDLESPESYRPQVGTHQHIDDVKVPLAVNAIEEEPLERLLNNFRQQGYPFEQYHPPVGFTYYYRDSAYLGIIILWRELDRSPISRETIETIDRMKPFLISLFTDVLVRFHHVESDSSASIGALDRITNDFSLTLQQRRVLALRATGMSPEVIADSMAITPHTVRSHLKTIYRKAGVHSVHELFARYFVSPLRKSRSE